MNLLRLRHDLSGARRATALLLGLLSISIAANLILAIASVSFASRERVILVPPEISKSFWVDRNRLSPEYLEQMGQFLLQLTLNVTPQSVDHQAKVLLQYVAPAASGDLRATLSATAERIKRDGAATVFALQDLTIDAAHQQLTARGRLTTYIGERRVSEIQKTYTLTFDTNAGRIVLTSFKEATPRDPLDPRPDAPAGT